MNTDTKPVESSSKEPWFILLLQYLLPVSFTCAMLGIITWIGSLILLSRKLDDTPSASMGISIVAIPVFLVLLAVFWYVFLGIIRNPDETPGPTASSLTTPTEPEIGDEP
ncbi:MAG: hypothetical protein HY706_18050 [Candidatus Hydrogenedentes bacterium]|nr:hypothetical protein [Candidatus Hydrogenedentota bacterium]